MPLTTPRATASLYSSASPSLNEGRHEIVFIEDNVADWEVLVGNTKPGMEIVVLDSRDDGLRQMADYLATKQSGSIDAVHVLSHGADARIDLGTAQLSKGSLETNAELLQSMGDAVKAGGQFLVYGCRIGIEGEGRQFVDTLGKLLGATVAASDDLTGATSLGGDWALEVSTGDAPILSAFPATPSDYDGILAAPTAPFYPFIAPASRSTTLDPEKYKITNVTTPTFAIGGLEAGAAVALFDDLNRNYTIDAGEELGNATQSGPIAPGDTGYVEITSGHPLSEGTHYIKVTQTVGGETSSPQLWTINIDTTAPTAEQVIADSISVGGTTHAINVVYRDGSGSGIDASSIGTGDVSVSGGATVTGASYNTATGVATYTVTAPGGTWDAADAGTYTVSIAGGEVKDLAGNAVAANPTAATFDVTTDTSAVLDLNGAGTGTGNTVSLASAASGLATATAIASDAELDGANWNGASLAVQRIKAGGAADGSVNDIYNFTSSTLFNATGGPVVKGADASGTLTATTGGAQFATWSYTSATGKLVVSFDANASGALVQDVVRHIGYSNATPYGNTTVRMDLNDGSTTTHADVAVTSSTIYVDQTAYDAQNDAADGFNLAEALAKAVDGDTILIQDGNYRGQFVATTAVTIDAVNGAGHVTLEAPDMYDLVASSQNELTSNPRLRYPILDLRTTVPGQGTVTVKNLTIDGRYQAINDVYNGNEDMVGIGVFNTGALIDGVTVTHIAAPIDVGTGDYSGMSENYGVLIEGGSSLGAMVNVTVQNSTINTYQKTGLIAWGPKLNVNILNNSITGVGVHGVSNQNGMQIGSANPDRIGTTGVIQGNVLNGLDTVSPVYSATAIIARQSGSLDINGNTVTVTRAPADNQTTGVDIMECSSPITVRNNTFSGLYLGVGLESPYGTSYSSSHAITGNNFNSTYYAIYDDAYGAVNPLSITINSGTVANGRGFLEYYLEEGNDQFTDTGSAPSTVWGGLGDDRIRTGSGADILIGGDGNDTLSGSGGGDIFQYAASANGVDTITDFDLGDAIEVTGRNFTAGTLTQGNGTNVAANSVQIAYSGGNTILYIDSDGVAGAADTEILLTGTYATTNSHLNGAFIRYVAPVPEPIPEPAPIPMPTPSPTPVDDGDNVSTTTENLVPSLPPSNGGAAVAGDGNGDGVADSAQANVSSLPFRQTDQVSQNPNAPATFVTLVAGSNAGQATGTAHLTSISQQDRPVDLPAEFASPLGQLSFSATAASFGATESFSLFVDGSLAVNGYWKQIDGHWQNIGTVTRVGDKWRIDFSIQDGGPFDADGVANGTISDPGVLAYLPLSLTHHAPDLPVDGFWF